LLAALCVTFNAEAARDYHRVQVAEAYLELRTGPGGGFPVYYVVERGAWLEVLKRRTDWFKVRAANGREGWVDRAQMESTLTEAGVPASFRDAVLGDFLSDRFEVGFATGAFEGDTVLAFRMGAKLTENFSAELSTQQVSGRFSSTRLTQVNLLAHPFPDWRVSPFFTIGVGRFRNIPKASLVSATETEATAGNAGLGVRVYVTRRFLLRGDFRQHVVPIHDNRIDKFKDLTVGVGVFF
jgi:hypothetical protein